MSSSNSSNNQLVSSTRLQPNNHNRLSINNDQQHRPCSSTQSLVRSSPARPLNTGNELSLFNWSRRRHPPSVPRRPDSDPSRTTTWASNSTAASSRLEAQFITIIHSVSIGQKERGKRSTTRNPLTLPFTLNSDHPHDSPQPEPVRGPGLQQLWCVQQCQWTNCPTADYLAKVSQINDQHWHCQRDTLLT